MVKDGCILETGDAGTSVQGRELLSVWTYVSAACMRLIGLDDWCVFYVVVRVNGREMKWLKQKV